MPDSKANNGWGIYAVRKLIEYTTMLLAVWQLGIPAANQWYVTQREAYDIKHKKEPFREITSKEMGVPADRAHIIIGEWYKAHEESEELLDAVFPMLEAEINNIRPRLEILPNNRAKWYHTDGDNYDASIQPDGFYWFFHPEKGWLPCHT